MVYESLTEDQVFDILANDSFIRGNFSDKAINIMTNYVFDVYENYLDIKELISWFNYIKEFDKNSFLNQYGNELDENPTIDDIRKLLEINSIVYCCDTDCILFEN